MADEAGKRKKKKLALTGCVLYATRHTKCCEKLLPAPFQRREKMGFQNVNTSVKITQPAKVGCDLELCSLVTGLCPAEGCHPRPSVLEPQYCYPRQCGPTRTVPRGAVGPSGVQLCQMALAGTLASRHGCSHPKGLDRTTGSKQCLPGALPKAKTPLISIKLYVLPGPKNNRVGSRRRKRQSPGCKMLDPRAMGICTPAVYRAQHLSCWAACTLGPGRGSWNCGTRSSRVEAPQQLWNQTCYTWLLEKARFLRCC